MPYILPEHRDRAEYHQETAGELNYAFTKLILEYLGAKPSYQKFNDVLGALEGCKLELYRRMVAPYEDKKISENGDVYNV